MRILLLGILILFSSLPVYSEILFGPIDVSSGEAFQDTFGMYCRCTAYFVEIQNGMGNSRADGFRIAFNDTTLIVLDGAWTTYSEQIELRETEPNEISFNVTGEEGAKVSVQVYERDVTSEPVPTRRYTKQNDEEELFAESFVLNHWADRFYLDITNGNPDGSNRISSGRVMADGVTVVDENELNDSAYKIRKEIEFADVLNLNHVLIITSGEAGDFFSMGIEEAAQTVTVEEIAEVEGIPYPTMGGISFDDELNIRVAGKIGVVDIDDQGNVTERIQNTYSADGEFVGVMSHRGSYTTTRAKELNENVYRLYDRDWDLIHEIRNENRRIQQVSEAGNYLLGYDPETIQYHPCNGMMVAVYNSYGVLVSKVPMSVPPDDFDVFQQISPDGLSCWVHCDDEIQIYGTDGILRWAAPWLQTRCLANSFMAAQGIVDRIIIYNANGEITRSVINPFPSYREGMEPRARLTPNGDFAGHFGDGFIIAKVSGPQSCWAFEPANDHPIGSWMSDNGKMVLSHCYAENIDHPNIRLVGAGGDIVWELNDFISWGQLGTMLSQEGDYFFLMQDRVDTSEYPKCIIYEVRIQ